VGRSFACALLKHGRAMCWGGLHAGDDRLFVSKATEVPGVNDAEELVISRENFCIRTRGGRALCSVMSMKVESRWDRDVRRMAASAEIGDDAVCVLLLDGSVKCAGFASVELSHQVEALTGLRSLALGADHACGIVKDGRVTCVGNNRVGQLGTGWPIASLTPVLVR
jgi:hypothetical protein